MKSYLLGELNNFYKANLHCHTTLSDGSLTPEQIKQQYLNKGYSVVAYSDHNTYANHQHLNDSSFLALAALEVDITNTAKDKPSSRKKKYHFNLFDKDPAVQKDVVLPRGIDYDDIYAINNYLQDMKNAGFLISYNHPYWSMQDYNDYAYLKNCFAMEIYNYGCELDGLYGYAPQVYDEMLRAGQQLFCVATDDNHNTHSFSSSMSDSFGGFIMIESKALTYDAVIQALDSGAFYSSMDPIIKEIYIEDGSLFVESSPVKKIYVITQTQKCLMRLADAGKTITGAQFELTGSEEYIRIDCRDEYGRHAMSNAYFL